MMRSRGPMERDRTLSSVVFPAPVPPEIRQLSLALTAALRNSSISGVMLLLATRFSAVKGRTPNLRMLMIGPSRASGGIIILTREPFDRRASTIGDDSST